MLVALKCARDMLTKMSYKGFEIKDEKDFCKCLLSIVIDYFGSIFHDEDNQHQETIFHHLAQGKSTIKCFKIHLIPTIQSNPIHNQPLSLFSQW